MIVTETSLPGVLLVEPKVHGDARGFFVETYHRHRYHDAGMELEFVQDNHSRSRRGTLRGLHAQLRRPQGKLLRCVEGEIFDVAVDARQGSPHYGQWVGEMLTAENFRQLYIPPGFLHGFCVLSDIAQVEYKCTDVYVPDDEISVAWDDPALGIEWPIDEPLLSQRDLDARPLAELADRFPTYSPPRGDHGA